MRDQWIRESQGCLLVYSITSRTSFLMVENLYQQILEVKAFSPSAPFPCVIVGNKSDIAYEREVSKEGEISTGPDSPLNLAEGTALAQMINCISIETSAKHALNVDLAFNTLVHEIRRNRELQEQNARRVGLDPVIQKVGLGRRVYICST